MLNIHDLPDDLLPLAKRLRTYDLRHPPAIYFLLRDGRVVYVGQTTELRRRIKEHKKAKVFDAVIYLPTEAEHLDAVEATWIQRLNPELNLARPSCPIEMAVPPLPRPQPKALPEPVPAYCHDGECECDEELPFGECEECYCNCDACEIRSVDQDLFEAIYVLGTKKLPPVVPPTPEEWAGMVEAVNRMCLPT